MNALPNIKNKISLYYSSYVKTPMLCGVFKYSIILPVNDLNDVALRHSFLHELAHYKHCDNLIKWLAILALRLHWFKPFVYKAVNELNLLCELRCDESATKCFSKDERLDYGKTLLTVASSSIREAFFALSSFGEDKRNLKERLEVLVNMKSRKEHSIRLINRHCPCRNHSRVFHDFL